MPESARSGGAMPASGPAQSWRRRRLRPAAKVEDRIKGGVDPKRKATREAD